MKTLLLAVVMGLVLVAAVWFSVRAWFGVDAVMSGHGWFALVIGVVLTAAVGVGLMALVFISSRRGYDDIDREP